VKNFNGILSYGRKVINDLENGEKQRKEEYIKEKHRNMDYIRNACGCVKAAKALYYIMLLALHELEC